MRNDEMAGNAYPQGEQAADQPIYPIMHRPPQMIPYAGYHPPQQMSLQTRLIGVVVVAIVGVGGLYLYQEHEKSKTVMDFAIPKHVPLPPDLPPAPPAPAPTTWWIGKWSNANGTAAPSLQLEPRGTLIVGLMLRTHQKGFLVSQPVRGGQASGDTVLFHLDDSGLQQPNYHPFNGQMIQSWFLLVQKAKQAELHRLPTPPQSLSLQSRGGEGAAFHPIRPTAAPAAVLVKEGGFDGP